MYWFVVETEFKKVQLTISEDETQIIMAWVDQIPQDALRQGVRSEVWWAALPSAGIEPPSCLTEWGRAAA